MNYFLLAAIGILSVFLLLCLIRAVIGPSIADRIVSVNMMGTMVIAIIAMLSVLQKEGYLADICIIYAMISFLSVVALTKVFLGIYRRRKAEGDREDD